METALYYTLSTLSQTLAGALGMLAAFLVLRVSSLDAIVLRAARRARRATAHWVPKSAPNGSLPSTRPSQSATGQGFE